MMRSIFGDNIPVERDGAVVTYTVPVAPHLKRHAIGA
jgi:hypothetical protein